MFALHRLIFHNTQMKWVIVLDSWMMRRAPRGGRFSRSLVSNWTLGTRTRPLSLSAHSCCPHPRWQARLWEIWFSRPQKAPRVRIQLSRPIWGTPGPGINPGSAITVVGPPSVSSDLAAPQKRTGVGGFLPEDMTQSGFQSLK